MKKFNDFLEKHPFPKSRLADILITEYDSLNPPKEDVQTIIAASMVTMQKVMDMRLRAYHQWLHASSDES